MIIRVHVVRKRVMHGYVVEESPITLEYELDAPDTDKILELLKNVVDGILSWIGFVITADNRAYYCTEKECLEVRVSYGAW